MSLNKIILFTIVAFFILTIFSCTKDEPSEEQKESFMKSFGSAYSDEAKDFIYDNGNYYILGTKMDNNENTLIYLVKTDGFGNMIWEKTYTKNDKQTLGNQIIKLEKQTGYAIIGSCEIDSDSLYYDTYLLIIDENGDILKEKTYSDQNFNNYGKCIAELDNGGFSLLSILVPKM